MIVCMRTTLELDDVLFRDLKREAAGRGVTLRSLVNELLQSALRHPKRSMAYRFNWKVDPPGSIQPGVRLNDRESLFELMDGR